MNFLKSINWAKVFIIAKASAEFIIFAINNTKDWFKRKKNAQK